MDDAFNYDDTANTDDGSCIEVVGCTDEAFNYGLQLLWMYYDDSI